MTKATPTVIARRSPSDRGAGSRGVGGVGRGPAPSSAAVSKSAGQIVAKAQAYATAATQGDSGTPKYAQFRRRAL